MRYEDAEPLIEPAVGQRDVTQKLALTMLDHSAQLRTYIVRHFPSDLLRQMDPDDVLQDIFFEALRRVHELSFHDDGSIYRWLVTVARHRMCSLLRRFRTTKRGGGKQIFEGSLISTDNEAIALLLQEVALYERTPSRSAIFNELVASLQQSIEQLSAEHKEAIRLRYMQGMAVREIALHMKRTEGAVEMLCNRALKKLRLDLRSSSELGLRAAARPKQS